MIGPCNYLPLNQVQPKQPAKERLLIPPSKWRLVPRRHLHPSYSSKAPSTVSGDLAKLINRGWDILILKVDK